MYQQGAWIGMEARPVSTHRGHRSALLTFVCVIRGHHVYKNKWVPKDSRCSTCEEQNVQGWNGQAVKEPHARRVGHRNAAQNLKTKIHLNLSCIFKKLNIFHKYIKKSNICQFLEQRDYNILGTGLSQRRSGFHGWVRPPSLRAVSSPSMGLSKLGDISNLMVRHSCCNRIHK